MLFVCTLKLFLLLFIKILLCNTYTLIFGPFFLFVYFSVIFVVVVVVLYSWRNDSKQPESFVYFGENFIETFSLGLLQLCIFFLSIAFVRFIRLRFCCYYWWIYFVMLVLFYYYYYIDKNFSKFYSRSSRSLFALISTALRQNYNWFELVFPSTHSVLVRDHLVCPIIRALTHTHTHTHPTKCATVFVSPLWVSFIFPWCFVALCIIYLFMLFTLSEIFRSHVKCVWLLFFCCSIVLCVLLLCCLSFIDCIFSVFIYVLIFTFVHFTLWKSLIWLQWYKWDQESNTKNLFRFLYHLSIEFSAVFKQLFDCESMCEYCVMAKCQNCPICTCLSRVECCQIEVICTGEHGIQQKIPT